MRDCLHLPWRGSGLALQRDGCNEEQGSSFAGVQREDGAVAQEGGGRTPIRLRVNAAVTP